LKVMKVGKKKNWIGGKVGWGLQVAVYSVDETGRNREYVDQRYFGQVLLAI